jgi:perosamine synthetase
MKLKMIGQRVQNLTNRNFSIPVKSGTDALYLSLIAHGIGVGDEVLVSNFSWVSTASCISLAGATPVFCDVDIDTYHMSMESIETMYSPKVKALIFPQLFGNMSTLDDVKKFCKDRNILLIEDSCQALGCEINGTYAGSIGNISTFSFNKNKVVSGITGGGMVLTDDEQIADKVRKLSHHGSGEDFEYLGINARMSDIDAETICKQLDNLDDIIFELSESVRKYDEFFEHLPVIHQELSEGLFSNHHKYTIRVQTKEIRDKLQDVFGFKVHYPKPISENSMYRKIHHRKDRCPNAQLICDTILTMPFEKPKEPVDELYHMLVEKIFTHPNWAHRLTKNTMKEKLFDAVCDIATR